MSGPGIAVQLFSVRDHLADDFEDTIARIADLGFTGVETAFVSERDHDADRAVFDRHGLTVVAVHAAFPVGVEHDLRVREARAYGTDRIVWHGYPRDPRYDSAEGMHALVAEIGDVAAALAADGMRLGVHNHWWEIADLGGYIPFRMIADSAPDVFFELDAYWSAFSGADPASLVADTLAGRVPLVHIKDGPLDDTASANVVLGEGAMDLDRVFDATATADWWIVEFDACESDIFEALARSRDHLVRTRPHALH